MLTDITYLPYNDTFAYLSTILDAFTKQILSYVISESLQLDFVLETVNILISDHGISLSKETIVHSDQGCHYTSYRFVEILNNKELRQSMSQKGNCWDNVPMERFFGRMKDHIGGRLKTCKEFSEIKAS
ncbi:MAG: DDE-type integrase/transposase/recombinase [Clostridiales bacterium]|nr:DDE-type integrase/transposase/recombinase [Clostridiales bacterium]MCD8126605.1 DDE-type integrase/transposase/recombinase [Clostridiales bacterium]